MTKKQDNTSRFYRRIGQDSAVTLNAMPSETLCNLIQNNNKFLNNALGSKI